MLPWPSRGEKPKIKTWKRKAKKKKVGGQAGPGGCREPVPPHGRTFQSTPAGKGGKSKGKKARERGGAPPQKLWWPSITAFVSGTGGKMWGERNGELPPLACFAQRRRTCEKNS